MVVDQGGLEYPALKKSAVGIGRRHGDGMPLKIKPSQKVLSVRMNPYRRVINPYLARRLHSGERFDKSADRFPSIVSEENADHHMH